MVNIRFLRAVEFLPEVGASILRQRDGVLNLLATASDLRRRAELIEEQAQQAQQVLERRVREIWSEAQLEAAAGRAGR
ncbi:stable inheritance protein KleA [Pollutimonas bauzanensis]|uniref:Uncharacterized protein n=1 Tax=Pollutimonas bauzanensis TaxID=658167 RepID=A0A1M5YJ58_9BURK|nr:stable inheritance protein KleA [Pollutimonas bauzanensis]SHI11958.1 hypothetical protein SAMN04488135_109137 [Pollutimonas bauzanensis]